MKGNLFIIIWMLIASLFGVGAFGQTAIKGPAASSYLIEGRTSTATAAGTTVLTTASSTVQVFTGTTTQSVDLPVATTLVLNRTFEFFNDSTGVVTIYATDHTTVIKVLLPKGHTKVKVTNIGTSNGSWVVENVAISLTDANVTGILPLSSGGSNKNMTAVTGGIVWTDADSQEVSAAGSSGQLLTSNGTSAPSWSSVSTLLDTTYFKQGGNSFTAAARLGTNDSNVLEFETNNTLVGTFSTTGKFAIGASSPNTSAKLDVQGTDGAILYPRLSTTNRNALTPTAGMQIYNTTTAQFECYGTAWLPCGGLRLVSAQVTLAAGFTITVAPTGPDETIRIQGSSAAVDSSATPFGTSTPREGYRVTLVGNSSTNTARIIATDAAKGPMPYSVTLGKFQAVTYEYNATLDRYFIVSFSN